MLRLLLTRLLLLLPLLLPAGALAVSLGDELILSRLGDPVEVEIEVVQWEDLDLDRVQISAASREEYEVFKLTWLPVLEHLSFNLVGPDMNGNVRVLVSSRDPLDEPFLELLLVLRWPGGSLRREYVLLFDPPGAPVALAPPAQEPEPPKPGLQEPQPQRVAFVAPPEPAPVVNEGEAAPGALVRAEAVVAPEPLVDAEAQSVVLAGPDEPVVSGLPPVIPAESTPPPPAPAGMVTAPATPAASPSSALPEPEPESEVEPAVDARTQVAIEVDTLAPRAPTPLPDTTRRTYQVRAGDSLWNIARQFLPAGSADNLYQMLLGIHDLNRGAFINGNISLLRANALLQLPSEADIAAIDPATAEAEFDRRWEIGTQRFEAVQRGEAIPLFAEVDDEEPIVPAEPELPPGVEAPPPVVDNGLIMVSATNTALPLQLAPALAAEPAGDEGIPAPDPVPRPFGADALSPLEPASAALASDTAADTTAEDSAATDAVSSTIVQTAAALATSNVVAVTELETELAAMRERRERAEALARELQESLQRARAERAAQSTLFTADNLILAGGALALLAALVAGVVFMLKLAGELRTERSNAAAARTIAHPDMPRSSVRATPSQEGARVEPTIGSPSPGRQGAPDATQIEVVELESAREESSSVVMEEADHPGEGEDRDAPSGAEAAQRHDTAAPDDLFARMEGILATAQKSPQK